MGDIRVGQVIELSDGRIATVRYVGQPHFAPGDWVGVELEDESGKNDGSVQGERYFDCDMGRGMFVRPTAVHIISGKPASVRMSVPDAGTLKRMSINAPSPSPAPRRSSMLRSPTKSPTKQLTGRVATPKPKPRPSSVSAPKLKPAPKPAPAPPAKRLSVAPVAASKEPSPERKRTTPNREVEDLKTKLRVMEKKRMEDRDKLKVLDKVQAERDKFESIIQKLQAKYQPQQQEITDLRKQIKEAEMRFEQVEHMQSEHEMSLEMATLDREMAEEMAEVYKAELDALKLRAEELELELDVLKEENTQLSEDMSPEEKASHGWLQMEKTNERLREALLRLRDMTEQQEEELRDEIRSLEEETRDLAAIKEHHAATQQKLVLSENTVEDLRQQLDHALGAEDMIEDLTERNMHLNEQIEELKATVEDLESLKELNDELEINHVEAEKELQEEIDFREAVIADQSRRATQQDETIEDMEYTLSRFRELVSSLQTDLEDLRASHAVSETAQLSSRTKEMQDLTLKLQQTATKSQAKAIDLELRFLDAQQASEHLAIVQLFLPDAYHADRDPVLALLRFKRVAFKARMLHGFVKEKHDDVSAARDMLDKLVWVASMADRFVNAMEFSTPDNFARYESALYELEPVERSLNAWIDALRKDELKEQLCADELQRTIAVLSHLAEVLIGDGLAMYADDIHMRAVLMQSYLDGIVMVSPSDPVVALARSAKVIVGKAVRSLEELKTRSLSLGFDTSDAFELCLNAVRDLVSSPTESRLRALIGSLSELAATAADLTVTHEFDRPIAPWVLRSQQHKSSKTITVDAEEEMRRLKDDNHERLRLIALRDQSLEEAAVKIETLESRMKEATKKSERLVETEKALVSLQAREHELAAAIATQNKELSTMEADRERWKKIASDAQALHPQRGQERAVATAREMETLKSEISSLQAAVRHLRQDNQRIRLDAGWLTPLVKPKTIRQQRVDLVKAEGEEVLNELLHLAEAPLVTLRQPTGWRPAKSTPQYHVAKQKEDLALWRSWQQSVDHKCRAVSVF